VTWVSVFGVSLAQVYSGSYAFDTQSIGLVGLSPWIFSIIASFGGPLADYMAKKMTVWNQGVYEPEFRLLLLIPSLIIGSIGYFGFGMSVEAGDHWIVPTILYGFTGMANVLTGIAVYTYVVDSHRNFAPEAFVSINFFKDALSFGFTFFVNDWIESEGVRQVFIVVGGIQVAVTVPAILLWVYGKKIRSWCYRNKALQKFCY